MLPARRFDRERPSRVFLGFALRLVTTAVAICFKALGALPHLVSVQAQAQTAMALDLASCPVSYCNPLLNDALQIVIGIHPRKHFGFGASPLLGQESHFLVGVHSVEASVNHAILESGVGAVARGRTFTVALKALLSATRMNCSPEVLAPTPVMQWRAVVIFPGLFIMALGMTRPDSLQTPTLTRYDWRILDVWVLLPSTLPATIVRIPFLCLNSA